jgi:hypothetical protein
MKYIFNLSSFTAETKKNCHGQRKATSSRDSDGNLVILGNFDKTNLNADRWNPRNENSNIGVCLSRSNNVSNESGVQLRLCPVFTFYLLDPAADDLAEFGQVTRKDHVRPVGQALRLVRDAEPQLDSLQFHIYFINQ